MLHKLRITRIPTTFALVATIGLSTGCKHDPNVEKRKYLESGIRYESHDDFRAAAIQFQNALKVDKSYSDAHYELSKVYKKMGAMNQAYAELQRTVDLSPANMQARIDLGNLLLAGGQPDRATEQANAILAKQSNNADAYALLSSIALAKGDRAQALIQIQHALVLDPNRANFHADLGLLQSSDPKNQGAALEQLQKAVSLDSTNVRARLMLAALLEKNNDMQGAEQQQIEAVKIAPTNLQARVSLAALYLRTGDKDKAEATLRKATEDLSDNQQGADLLETYYVGSGQLDKGESVYAGLVSSHPKSFALKMAYARILMVRGEFDKANVVAKELTAMNSADPQVAALNATLLMQAGKSDEAFNLLQTATKNSPDNIPIKVLLGLAAQNRGDLALAETNFRDAAQHEPGNLNAQRGLAELSNRRGENTQLRQVAETTMRYHPDLPDAYIWRGTAEANDHQYDQAAADFQTVLKKYPRNASALYELGTLRLQQQHVPEGKSLLEQALQVDPNSRALPLLVQTDLRANQPAQALSRIQQQIARSPANSNLYDELAMVQLAEKDPKSAVASAEKAMQINSSDVSAVRFYTQAEITLGDIGPATTVWEHWSQIHPSDPQGPSMLGMLSEAAGEPEKAMDYYKKALQLQPDQPIASNNLAFLMVENNQNLDVALSLAQSAHRILPDSPSTADTLAWVYYHKGIFESARDLLEIASKADPNNASIQYHLGMTYSKLADKSNAAMHLKKASELSPNTQVGKDAKDELNHLG